MTHKQRSFIRLLREFIKEEFKTSVMMLEGTYQSNDEESKKMIELALKVNEGNPNIVELIGSLNRAWMVHDEVGEGLYKAVDTARKQGAHEASSSLVDALMTTQKFIKRVVQAVDAAVEIDDIKKLESVRFAKRKVTELAKEFTQNVLDNDSALRRAARDKEELGKICTFISIEIQSPLHTAIENIVEDLGEEHHQNVGDDENEEEEENEYSVTSSTKHRDKKHDEDSVDFSKL